MKKDLEQHRALAVNVPGMADVFGVVKRSQKCAEGQGAPTVRRSGHAVLTAVLVSWQTFYIL